MHIHARNDDKTFTDGPFPQYAQILVPQLRITLVDSHIGMPTPSVPVWAWMGALPWAWM